MQKADQKGAGLQTAESVGWGYVEPISDRVHDVVCVCQLCLGDTALWPPYNIKRSVVNQQDSHHSVRPFRD